MEQEFLLRIPWRKKQGKAYELIWFRPDKLPCQQQPIETYHLGNVAILVAQWVISLDSVLFLN